MWLDVKSSFAALLKKGVYTDLLDDEEYRAFLMRGNLNPPFTQYRSGIPAGSKARYELACAFTAESFTRKLEKLNCLKESGAKYPLKAAELQGNNKIYRVAETIVNDGRADGKRRVKAEWWFTEDLLLRCLAQSKQGGFEYQLFLLEHLRNRLAICEDWNLVTTIWEMKLRGQVIPVIQGEGLPQGVFSPHAKNKGKVSAALYRQYDNQIFKGGELQIWLPWLPRVPITEIMTLPRNPGFG